MAEQDDVFQNIEELAEFREDVASLAASAAARLENSDKAIELRDAMLDVIHDQNIFEATVAISEVMYFIVEQIENESIIGFMKEHGTPLEEEGTDG